MSLAEYKQMDLSFDGPAARTLLDAAPREAESSVISLSAEYNADDSQPPFFTPIMKVWYRHVVASPRGTALQEIREEFSSIDLGKGQRGFLLEGERDRIASEKFRQIGSERDQFFSNEKVNRVTAELAEAKRTYEQMKAANGGEDANEWSTRTYILVLGILALPELPLNYESFTKFPILTPAMAVALIFAVAAGIAASSHIVGTTYKQWGHLFGGYVSQRDKMKAYRQLGIGVLLFAIAMGIVTTGRSMLFQEDIQRKLLIGEPLSFADYMGFGFSVGGNLLIWTLGVAVAIVAHSDIPGFGAKQKLVKKRQDEISALHAKDLQHRSDRHISKAQHDLDNINQLEVRQLRSRPDYVAARTKFEEFRRVDNQVLAVLDEYRSRLADEVRRRGGTTFEIEEIDSLSRDMRRQIGLSSFEHLKLRLPYA